MAAFVYMLKCSDGSLYVGSTRDLAQRLFQHQEGLGADYTRSRRPVELVWHEEHENVALAFSREKQVQNWSRKKRLALIAGDYERLPALARKDFAPGRPASSADPSSVVEQPSGDPSSVVE